MTGDGSDTTLTLNTDPVNENNVQVYIDGTYQNKDTFSVSGTTLTFSEAPPNGTKVEAIVATQTTINTATQLLDADGDTKVMVEESSDEDKIRFDTGGSQRMVIDDSGNIGIGTDSPTTFSGFQTLHLKNGSGDALMLIESDGGIISQDIVSDSAGIVTVGARSNHPYRITTNDTERLRVTTDGDLLVRQTSADVYDTNTGGTVRQYWGNQFSASNNTNSRVIIGSGSNAGLVGGATLNSGGTRPIVNSYISFGSTSQTAGSEAGMVQFYTSTGGATGAVRARIDSDGLKFGSDTSALNALDDYEEGSWTPTLPNGGSVVVRTATYTKVGRHVMAYMYCQFAPTNNSSTFNIGGLPYTVVNNSNYYGGGSLSYSGTEDTSSFSDPLTHYNANFIYFHYLTGSSLSIKNSQFGGRTINLILQVHYETAA